MRYAVLNLGAAEPERYVPEGLMDCSSVAEYRRAVENAAARISYYNQEIQRAAASENYGAVDRAKAAADQANHDWEVWSKAVKKCEEASVESEAAPKSEFGTLVAVGGIALIAIAVVAGPKIKFWMAGGK